MASRIKYSKNDLQSIVDKKKTISEIAKKYNVKEETLRRQMNRRGYKRRMCAIKITSPYGTKIVPNQIECANELAVSQTTISRALRGERIALFEELNIYLEKVEEKR